MLKVDVNALQKNCNVDIRYCNILSDERDENENKRFRILEADGKYYYHEMQHGEVINCFEVAIDWKTDNFTLYSFTPDGKHIYRIDGKKPSAVEHIYKLADDYIIEGMQCNYNGIKITYISDNEIMVNNKKIVVDADSSYTYRLLKRKIYAAGGAKGLFAFLDNIAEYGKFDRYPLFHQVYDMLFNKYCNV